MSKKGSEFKDFHFSKIYGSPQYINKNIPPPLQKPKQITPENVEFKKKYEMVKVRGEVKTRVSGIITSSRYTAYSNN